MYVCNVCTWRKYIYFIFTEKRTFSCKEYAVVVSLLTKKMYFTKKYIFVRDATFLELSVTQFYILLSEQLSISAMIKDVRSYSRSKKNQ